MTDSEQCCDLCGGDLEGLRSEHSGVCSGCVSGVDAELSEAIVRRSTIVTENGNPAIEIPGGARIELRAVVNEWDYDHPNHGADVPMRTAVDADDSAWWTLYPKRSDGVTGRDAFPEVVIEPSTHAPEDDEERPELRTDGSGESRDGSGIPRWICTGCGKAVGGSIPVDICSDCGGEWVEATPDRLACDGCGAEDASRVLNSEHNRLCERCIRRENSIPVDALEELRKEWEKAARGSTSGRALGLETAADELRVLVEEHKGLPDEDDEPEIRADGSGEAAKDQTETEYTVGEHRINIEGDLGRPEVFVETSPEETLPSTRATLLRDSNAVELYEQLGEYVREQGLIEDVTTCVECGTVLDDPKNRGDPDVNGDWVCSDPVCRAHHDAEMTCEIEVNRYE